MEPLVTTPPQKKGTNWLIVLPIILIVIMFGVLMYQLLSRPKQNTPFGSGGAGGDIMEKQINDGDSENLPEGAQIIDDGNGSKQYFVPR